MQTPSAEIIVNIKELADQIVQLGPGDYYTVEPIKAHRPFNPDTSQVVVVSDKPLFPQSFAAYSLN